MEATWEPAKKLNSAIIDNFEKSITMETIHETNFSYGQTNFSYGQTITNLHLRNSTSSIAGKRWQSKGEDCINDNTINTYTG